MGSLTFAGLGLSGSGSMTYEAVNSAKNSIKLANEAFANYQVRKWKLAHDLYGQILDLPWALLMQRRCLEYQKKSPLKQWDGVYSLDKK